MIIESIPYVDGKPKYDLREITGCMRHLVREIDTVGGLARNLVREIKIVSEQAKVLIEAADDLEKRRLTGGQDAV